MDNYKRATIVVDGSDKLDFQIEGKGPLILDGKQYRLMAIAASEMLTGHMASCWQDVTVNGEYIRVIKAKNLCKRQCTKSNVNLGEIKKKPNRVTVSGRIKTKPFTFTFLPEILGLRSKKT